MSAGAFPKLPAGTSPWYTTDTGTMLFEEFLEQLLAKLPGAVRLESDGQLVYARARNGARRLVGCTVGIDWPPDHGPLYDILEKRFYGHAKRAPLDGPVTGPYMEEVYPMVKDQIESERAQARQDSRRWR